MTAAEQEEADAEKLVWRLASVAYAAGDLQAAHEAFLVCVRDRGKRLPDDHPDLQMARGNLAATKFVGCRVGQIQIAASR